MSDPVSANPPTLSVIIPAYNRERSILRAVSSVASASKDCEIIVVDDGSTDATAGRAREALSSRGPAGRLLSQANAGPGAARNAGANAARGRYLAFLDSDDYWYPHTLDACLQALEGAERPALVFLQTQDVEEGHDTAPPAAPAQVQLFAGFLEAVSGYDSTRYGSCNVIVRADVYRDLAGFTDEVRCSEDTDLFLRAADAGPCMVLSGTPLVAHVTGHGERLTGSFRTVLAGYEYMLRRESEGLYPEGPQSRRAKHEMLAKCAIHTALSAFAAGHVGTAYGLYLQSVPRLVRAGNWHWLLRVPLVPVLAILRPSSYSMRWTAARQRG